MVFISWATYVLQWNVTKRSKTIKANLKKHPTKCELFSETRKHKVGIASNRKTIELR